MDPIKRITDATNLRPHQQDAKLRQADVKLSRPPAEEWVRAFKNGPGMALGKTDLNGDIVIFGVESDADVEKKLVEIDRRIQYANLTSR